MRLGNCSVCSYGLICHFFAARACVCSSLSIVHKFIHILLYHVVDVKMSVAAHFLDEIASHGIAHQAKPDPTYGFGKVCHLADSVANSRKTVMRRHRQQVRASPDVVDSLQQHGVSLGFEPRELCPSSEELLTSAALFRDYRSDGLRVETQTIEWLVQDCCCRL